jgi:serine/threonine-protein kinase
MICGACGHSNDEGAESCFGCGRPLTPTATIRQGSLVGSRYEILSLLGRGGMGVVYRARDRVLDEVVALKVLRETADPSDILARRFLTEIKLARRVTHPNVCRIHDYGEEPGLRYISMELLQGNDLRKRLADKGRLPASEAYAITGQVADGLQAIHAEGIVHRDLKASNIMVDERGLVKLMDFGIAKQVQSGGSGVTATGHVVGTPEYMSPEQARGDELDARSDVYALGVVMYEAFTGRVPFHGRTPIETILMHIHEAPPLDGSEGADIPLPLLPVLRRAMAKEPQDRFESAAEAATALRAAARAGEATLSPPARPAPTAVEIRPRRSRPLLALGLVSLCGAAVAAALFLRQASPPRPGSLLPMTSPTTTPTTTLASPPVTAAATTVPPVPDPSASPALDETRARVEAARAAEAQGPEAVPRLVELTKDKDAAVLSAAIRALVRIGGAGLAFLREPLKDPDPERRRAAMGAILEAGPPPEVTLDFLAPITEAVQDADPEVREMALQELASLGASAQPSVDALRLLLADAKKADPPLAERIRQTIRKIKGR